jgi:transposase InsO family protein
MCRRRQLTTRLNNRAAVSPPLGSASSLEQRRRQAVQAVDKGDKVKDVARIIGVSPCSVYRWLKMANKPDGLDAKPVVIPSGKVYFRYPLLSAAAPSLVLSLFLTMVLCHEPTRIALPAVARKQARLIAFIDDTSRVLCHGEFFFEENVDTLVQALRAAFYKRGVPEQLLVDNGSIYCSQEITLVCARVGCLLRHTAVRDAAAKGKIERFFRRVRDQFLVQKLDLSSLEALNRQFAHWVEQDYNGMPHDALGMKPIDRFGIDLTRVRFLPPSEHNDELF